MPLEYLLLIIVSYFPLLYKLVLWGNIFEVQEYSIKRFLNYISSKQWREEFKRFWIFLEIPLFILTLSIFVNPLFEVFIYNIVFYFFVLYNIFVLWKIFRWRFVFPKNKIILFMSWCLLIWDWLFSMLLDQKYIYMFLLWALLFMPLYFIATIFIRKAFLKIYYK